MKTEPVTDSSVRTKPADIPKEEKKGKGKAL